MSRTSLILVMLLAALAVAYAMFAPAEDPVSLCGIGCAREVR